MRASHPSTSERDWGSGHHARVERLSVFHEGDGGSELGGNRCCCQTEARACAWHTRHDVIVPVSCIQKSVETTCTLPYFRNQYGWRRGAIWPAAFWPPCIKDMWRFQCRASLVRRVESYPACNLGWMWARKRQRQPRQYLQMKIQIN
jgi:hypothetical protein